MEKTTIVLVLGMALLAACGGSVSAESLGSSDAGADVGAGDVDYRDVTPGNDASPDVADARPASPEAAPDVAEASPAPEAGGADASADGAQDAPEDASSPEAGDPCAGQRDGTKLGGTMVCCGGATTDVSTSSNCGVCGARCSNTERCEEPGGYGYYACFGCFGDSDCWSGTCANPNNTVASSYCGPTSTGSCGGAVACPTGSTCVAAGGWTFCTY